MIPDKNFNEFILNINSDDNQKLNEACESLKSNQQLRQNINKSVYEYLYFQIEKYLKNENTLNETSVLWIKLLRNSSGTNKTQFLTIENDICILLIEYLNNQVKLVKITNENFIIFMLQYFANLIQGVYFNLLYLIF